MVDIAEDWSEVRSPSRARRRRRQGHRQRIKILHIPKPEVYRMGPYITGHPETIRKLKEQIRANALVPELPR